MFSWLRPAIAALIGSVPGRRRRACSSFSGSACAYILKIYPSRAAERRLHVTHGASVVNLEL